MTGSKKDYINYRIEKSAGIFEDASLLANNGRWNSCVNRLYYSSYYIIRALLFKNEIKSETHNGVKTQFFKNYIKTGIIETSLGKLYSHLLDWRQETDYAGFVEFDKETVLPLMDQVKELNSKIKGLI